MNESLEQPRKLVRSENKGFWFLFLLLSSMCPTLVRAQVIPDALLPNNSTVTSEANLIRIEGGTQSGGNLFHSFTDFSIPSGTEALFNNAGTIEHIITRVTGGKVSNIDGTISANGTANLFLLNPAGMVFGPGAQLNIGGSFIASSASRIQFADGSFYSATDMNTEPLLTISVPLGLQFGENPGAIVNRSQSLTRNPQSDLPLPTNTGLEVAPGRTLALVGGDILLEGGNLTALQGEIKLASIGSGGIVTFSPTLTGLDFNYASVATFGNIDILGNSTLNVSGLGGGSIRLRGREIEIGDDASIFAITFGDTNGRGMEIEADRFRLQNSALISTTTLGAGNAGSLTIRAPESVEISGLGAAALRQILLSASAGTLRTNQIQFGILLSTQGAGRAGTMTIETGNLTMKEGAFLSTSTNARGAGGNMILRASAIDIDSSATISSAGPFSTANAGQIVLETGTLRLVNGGAILATTLGSGLGGNITINADTVAASGSSVGRITGFSSSSLLGTGRAGNIEIDARRIVISEGAFITSGSGGTIESLVVGGGAGGNIILRASESIEVRGISPETEVASVVATRSVSDSPAGNIRIETRELIVSEGASLNVAGGLQNNGAGDAGTLEIVANSIRLEAGGSLSASTASGQGGNISIQTRDLRLRGQSTIATNADNSDGGNIAIAADNLVALENSDITANAQAGFGGRVNISATGIFGTQFREQLTPESDITATSNLGPSFSGVVEINTPDVQPAGGLLELSSQLQDQSQLVTQSCQADSGNEFYIVGRGGLPTSPYEPLVAPLGETNWVEPAAVIPISRHSTPQNSVLNHQPSPKTRQEIIEATAWAVSPTGEVFLVVAAPNSHSRSGLQMPTDCSALQSQSSNPGSALRSRFRVRAD
ncbi:MAG TPA: S-layer family protein [Oscillatoriaceae cyanobacterium M33_DOE_052]|uniref:S-layer family protein n=1 Tax=Planktothricoides sp. SpSt-374 TaxID=2282167 RepID=A0A7C4A0N1_9CYAN|nr:S-layer family protein [Oscillatoriaceae cyanobacterium M33_DOE_052]